MVTALVPLPPDRGEGAVEIFLDSYRDRLELHAE